MLSGIGSALSGLAVAQTMADAASRNIANASTAGYGKVVAAVEESAQGGAKATLARVDGPGTGFVEPASGGERLTEMSNVELTEEIPTLDFAKITYQANLKTLQTQDEMLGSLLDLFR